VRKKHDINNRVHQTDLNETDSELLFKLQTVCYHLNERNIQMFLLFRFRCLH